MHQNGGLKYGFHHTRGFWVDFEFLKTHVMSHDWVETSLKAMIKRDLSNFLISSHQIFMTLQKLESNHELSNRS